MKDFSIKQSQGKTILFLIGSLICCAIFVLLTVVAFGINWLIFALSLLGSAYFFSRIMFNTRRLIKPIDIVSINREGIIDNSNRNCVGKIKWEEIKNIEKVNFMGTKFIGISLKDTDTFLKRLNEAQRKNVLSNIKTKCPPIEIVMDSAKGTFDENLSCILNAWEEHKTPLSTKELS